MLKSMELIDIAPMGRRKERRLAAISAAGRRVKLDLFAEPTEVAGKPLQDEAGEDLGQEKYADVPTSPSCSGQKENPLLLLGQYSDDEADESSSKIPNFAADGTSLVDTSLKVDEHITSSEQSDISADPYAADGPKLESDGLAIHDKLDGVVEESNTWASENKIESSTEKSPLEDSSLQNFGEISSEWKIVMHEESKSYYYWNTLTGETSWEVPNFLVNAGKTSAVTSDICDLGIEAVGANIDGVEFVSANASACTTTNAGNGGGHLNIVYNVSQPEPKCQTGEVDAHYCMSSGLIELSSEHLAIPLDRETREAFVPQVGEDASELQERTYAHSTGLIRKCQDLLEKLKASEESGRNISQQTWAYKCIIELETRLSDCRSLLSFGSSIIPFWRNTEVQLHRIKTAIAENSGIKDFGHPDEVGDLTGSLNSNNPIVEKEGVDAVNPVIASSRSPDHNLHPDINQCPVLTDIRKSKSPHRTPETELNEMAYSVGIEQSVYLQPESNVDLDPHEDADMDVEMELDDDIPASPLGTVESIGMEQPGCQHAQACIPPVPSDEFIVPPPPDEEYPPPPPDGDLVPLPPTEEPPSIPEAPYSETVQHLPYMEHYDTPYSAPSYQYYAATVTEAQSSGYYSHIEGSHVAQTQNQEYFELVASTSYPQAPVAVAVEPVVLYAAHTGVVPSGPVSTNYESSVIYAEHGVNDPSNIYTSGLNGSVEFVKNIDEKMELLSQKVESELANFHSEIEGTGIPVSTSSLVASKKGDALSNGNVADAAFTAARNQTKARTKKRVSAVASTLRSNKKVSSLVDKWRAAKEELHGDDDDEPEDAYEIFEKKRKKEIEEWHAKQIASGEAQDNANFVPLRGDWRQRVKRKQNSESSAVSSQAPAEQVVKDKRQPDLLELAKGLPPGWQAYWDENSKEVYYGNLKTSETTWTRPSI